MVAFVEVAAFVPVRGTYCYALPPGLGERARVGARVLVPFGGRGVTGVIVGAPGERGVDDAREIRSLLDDAPALDEALVALCMWVADYYEAPPGEVLRAALPPGTSESFAARLRLSERGRDGLYGNGGALADDVRRALLSVEAGKGARLRRPMRKQLLQAGL